MKESLLYCFSPRPNLEFHSIIGSGSFGTVFKAYDKHLNKYVAIKRSIKLGQSISREYKMLKMVSNSEHCIHLSDIFYTVNKSNEFIQHLVFEFMPDNLSRVLRSRYKLENPLSLLEITQIMFQLLKGIEFLHSKGIMHRDIKPENILIVPTSNKIKICDFGSAKIETEVENIPYVVSRFYRAPELILACTSYGKEIDIWAAGCIFVELFTGIPTFMGANDGDQLLKQLGILGKLEEDSSIVQKSRLQREIIDEVLKIGEKKDLKEYFERAPRWEIAKDLAENMLRLNPKERLTASQCIRHEFFENFSEIIKDN